MQKIFLQKLLMMFLTVAVIGGISTTTLPMLHSEHTAFRKSQTSNTKENNIKDVSLDSQNTNKKDDDKDIVSVSDEQKSSDNSQNNNDINKQQTSNTKQEKSSSNTNNQMATSTQSKNTNNNVSTKKQTSTATTSQVKVPTIYYDRTTSIYANDNITLLRVEYYKNNKLTYYSVVEQFDAEAKSYVEKIYQCNRVTNIDPLIRTDVYVNGNLTKSY